MNPTAKSIRIPHGYLSGVTSPEPVVEGHRLSENVKEVIEPFLSVRTRHVESSPRSKLAGLFGGGLGEVRPSDTQSRPVQDISFNLDEALVWTVGSLPAVTPFVNANPTAITNLMAILGIAGWVSTKSAVELAPRDAFVYAAGYDRATRERRRSHHDPTITEGELVWEVFFVRWSVPDRRFLRAFVDDDAVRQSIQRLVDLGCLSRTETKRGEQLVFNQTVSNTFEVDSEVRGNSQSQATV